MTATYPISLRVKMIRETEEFLEENLPVKGVVEAHCDVEHEPQEMVESEQPGENEHRLGSAA